MSILFVPWAVYGMHYDVINYFRLESSKGSPTRLKSLTILFKDLDFEVFNWFIRVLGPTNFIPKKVLGVFKFRFIQDDL